MLTDKKIELKTQNQELAVDPYMLPRRTGMHTYDRRAYESVDEKTLSWAMSRKTRNKEFKQ